MRSKYHSEGVYIFLGAYNATGLIMLVLPSGSVRLDLEVGFDVSTLPICLDRDITTSFVLWIISSHHLSLFEGERYFVLCIPKCSKTAEVGWQ